MQSAPSEPPVEIEDKDKEATQIIIAQISLLITSLTKDNFSDIEKKILYLLDKSSKVAYIKYWQKLIIVCSRDIKPGNTASPENNLVQRLLFELFKSLEFKAPEVIDLLNRQIFYNKSFFDSIGTSAKDLLFFFGIEDNKNILHLLIPTLGLEHFKIKNSIRMNNSTYFETVVLQGPATSFSANLSQVVFSLEGESLNDMIALMLSEILSPGSQKVQQFPVSSWFTPNSIVEATTIGILISQCLDKLPKGNIDWNRVFNLMSTKYFLTTPVKPTLSSLSSLLASLKHGNLVDQFFNCDWNMNFKLELAFYLHKWRPDEGCFDLLAVEGTKKVTDIIPNSKKSPLYLMSIASLDLELFLLRDELANNPMLPYYQECFFEDFNFVPEYLAFALSKDIKHFTLLTENRTIIDEIMVTLIVQVFEKSPEVSATVISQLPDAERIIEAGRIILNKETLMINDFIKVLWDEDKLTYFIERIPFEEALKILPNARKLGWYNFENYLKKSLSTSTASIILDYLDAQTKSSDINSPFNSSNTFDLQALHFIITLLVEFPLNQEDRGRFETIQFSLIIAFPRLINFGFGHDQAILSNGDLTPISSDVEKEMQDYLQKMYSGELAIKDIIDILRSFRDSDVGRDQDVFSCMTHAVIAESNFFRDYPMDALATTSVLFGSMILFQLLRGFVLDVAFRIILGFAKEGPESKMFKFAIQAIYAFKIRLSDYPNYSKDLLESVPGLQSQPQVYQSVVEASLKAQEIGKERSAESRSAELIRLKYFVVDEPRSSVAQENPPKEITEKVLFVVNNITMDNFDTKITDLKSVLTPNYFAWFSNYLVNQRAKTEPNYHKLYSRILVSIGSNSLHEYMIAITEKQLFYILSAKDLHSIDKNLLKNLSLWLGSITLAIDRPIRHRTIAFREMLLEAYQEKRLEIVVPFVAKVLHGAVDSKVFRPPNPWTLGILKVLLELNNKANWKLSLTFEVEVLLKTLNIQASCIAPTNFLDTDDIADELSGNLNNMSLEQKHTEQQRQIILMQQYQQQIALSQQRQQRVVSNGAVFPADQGPMAVESSMPSDNPFSNLMGSTIFATHPDLKRVFQMAIAKSVREILLPAVEKASSIAVVTTIKIILKDFATEVDEMKLKTAAITMVRHLAQSLARATSVELLKDGIRSTTQSLAPNIMSMPTSPVEELETAINDNIGLALALIENASMDKSTQDIGEQLMQPIAIRRYHKERRSDQPFLTQNTNPYSLSLPEPLGLNSSGVTPNQFRLYENSGKSALNVDQVSNIAPHAQQQTSNQQILMQQQQARSQQPPISQANQMPIPLSQNQVPIQNTQNMGIQNELEQNHRVLVHLMDSLVIQIKENADKKSLLDLGGQNPIKAIIFQILTFIARSSQKDQLALKVSQAVVNSLFATSESSLCREVLSLLLEKLCSLSMVARKDVVWWLVYALDSRKFNVSVIRSLLDVKLIDANELDNVLVTAMKNDMDGSVAFAKDIIRNTVISESPTLMRMDFVRTLEYLGSLSDPSAKAFLKEYESNAILPVNKGAKVTEKERYYLVFTEWVKLLQRVESDDINTLVFIKQMIEKGVLSNTDNLIEFIKAALELSVFSFKESDPTGEVFTSIDALGKLITKLLVLQEFSEIDRSEYLNIILSVISVVFAKDHEQKDTTFNERPHFRLLSNLLYEWETLRAHNFIRINDAATRKELSGFDTDFYNIFSTYLHSLQPIAFPGFSFAWVTLISHRMFLPTMLRLPNKSGWKNLMLTLIDLLNFLDTYTDKSEVSNAVSVVYKGALRVFLGISNDVPEFLIENHLELMNNLPATYFQLKNVILSAIPKKMILPNPYDPSLTMDQLSSCEELPSVFYDPISDSSTMKKPVDNYLRIPSNSLLRTILHGIYRTEYDIKNGVGYDFLTVDSNLVRAIVLHVGIEVGLENQKMSSSAVFNTKSSYFTLLFNLIHDGTIELKYQVIQAMVEQLRFPNIHTYWFSYTLKIMFSSEDWGEQLIDVQEIILRNLLERIIVNKPHAWGVSVLFSQFIRDKKTNLLELPFVKNLPEIENILAPLYKHTLNGSRAVNEHIEEAVKSESVVDSLDASVQV